MQSACHALGWPWLVTSVTSSLTGIAGSRTIPGAHGSASLAQWMSTTFFERPFQKQGVESSVLTSVPAHRNKYIYCTHARTPSSPLPYPSLLSRLNVSTEHLSANQTTIKKNATIKGCRITRVISLNEYF